MNFIKDCITFFQAGGIFMYPLAACSILLIAAIIYRMFNMRRRGIAPDRLVRAVEQYMQGGLDRRELEERALASRSVLGRKEQQTLNSLMEDAASKKEMKNVKETEEFVGSLGTASGLVEIFSVFGMDESHGQIAQGIAQALNTTIAGLAIATPAVIAHVYYSRKLERISAFMEVLLTELISFRYHSQR